MCIETQVAGHRLVVSIECRDHVRKQAVGWVDEMHAKHSRLPTDHLVLVSSSGFTSQALRVAESYNISTIVPNELTEERAVEIGARISRVWLGNVQLVQVNEVRTTVSAIEEPITVPPELGDMPIFIKTGAVVGRMKDIVHSIVTSNYSTGQISLNPPDNIDSMDLHLDNLRVVVNGETYATYLRIPDGDLSELHRITLTGNVQHIKSDVSMRHGQFQQIVYSWGEAVLEGKLTLIVATEAADGSATVSLRSLP